MSKLQVMALIKQEGGSMVAHSDCLAHEQSVSGVHRFMRVCMMSNRVIVNVNAECQGGNNCP